MRNTQGTCSISLPLWAQPVRPFSIGFVAHFKQRVNCLLCLLMVLLLVLVVGGPSLLSLQVVGLVRRRAGSSLRRLSSCPQQCRAAFRTSPPVALSPPLCLWLESSDFYTEAKFRGLAGALRPHPGRASWFVLRTNIYKKSSSFQTYRQLHMSEGSSSSDGRRSNAIV